MDDKTYKILVVLLCELYQRELRVKYVLDKAAETPSNTMTISMILDIIRDVVAGENEQDIIEKFCNKPFLDGMVNGKTLDQIIFFDAAMEINTMCGYTAITTDGSADPELNLKAVLDKEKSGPGLSEILDSDKGKE